MPYILRPFALSSALLGGVLAFGPLRADTILQYDVSGSFLVSSTTFSFTPGSTLNIDTSTGLAVDADLGLTDGTNIIDFTGVPIINTTIEYLWGGPSTVIGSTCLFGCVLRLEDTAGSGFAGFAGGAITGGALLFHPVGSPPDNFINVPVLTVVGTVPEPGTFALFGFALLAVAVLRSRVGHRRPIP